MKKQIEKAETCSMEGCKCGCGFGKIISPLAIIALVWFWPAATGSKIVVTILAALGILAHFCPCNKK